ncbi:MAG TPA: T9SS type A sorting domain-containing protein, partial [Bacteroidia bacterium]|nr:T9SS type A sorting domain-containing protein [Bacteroidia bacterium]
WNGVIHYNTTLGSTTYLWSTSGVTPVITEVVNSSTAYSVEVNIPGCPFLLHDTIDIVVSTPIVFAPQDFSVCNGDSATLTGTGIGPTQFFWDQAVTNNVPFVPFATDIFVVTGMDIHGCTDTDTVLITVNSLPVVSAGNDTTVCANSMFTLNGSGAATYTWDGGITDGVPFAVMMTATYEVIGTDINGCVGNDSITVVSDTVDASVTVVNETITANNSTATYQWIDCSTMTPIAGETNQSYTATVNGSYAVIVTDGICSDTSVCEVILSTGIAGSASVNAVTIFPNPASNEFTVNTGNFVAEEILVTDVLGKAIARIQPSAAQVNVSLENEPSGIYFVRITSAMEQHTVRVVKN